MAKKFCSIFVFALMIGALASPAKAMDPRVRAGLKKGQNYEFARKRLIHLGFTVAPTNIPMTNFEADKTYPEITCGYLKDELNTPTTCAVSFENRRGDYISLELRKTRWGFVLTEL
jgi:hypothetical protein